MITAIWDNVLAEIQKNKNTQTDVLLAAAEAQKAARDDRGKELIRKTVDSALDGTITYEYAVQTLKAVFCLKQADEPCFKPALYGDGVHEDDYGNVQAI